MMFFTTSWLYNEQLQVIANQQITPPLCVRVGYNLFRETLRFTRLFFVFILCLVGAVKASAATYTLTIDYNDGGRTASVTKTGSKSSVTLTEAEANPTREGYTFGGWLEVKEEYHSTWVNVFYHNIYGARTNGAWFTTDGQSDETGNKRLDLANNAINDAHRFAIFNELYLLKTFDNGKENESYFEFLLEYGRWSLVTPKKQCNHWRQKKNPIDIRISAQSLEDAKTAVGYSAIDCDDWNYNFFGLALSDDYKSSSVVKEFYKNTFLDGYTASGSGAGWGYAVGACFSSRGGSHNGATYERDGIPAGYQSATYYEYEDLSSHLWVRADADLGNIAMLLKRNSKARLEADALSSNNTFYFKAINPSSASSVTTTTIRAIWIPNLIIDPNGGLYEGNATPTVYKSLSYGDAQVVGEATREGYTLGGWLQTKESHGAKWVNVLYHNIASNQYFKDNQPSAGNTNTNAENSLESVSVNDAYRFSILNQLGSLKTSSYYEFLLEYGSTQEYNRWQQDNNPVTIDLNGSVQNYKAIDNDWTWHFGGLRRGMYRDPNVPDLMTNVYFVSFLSGDEVEGNCWYTVGGYVPYTSGKYIGVPAYKRQTTNTTSVDHTRNCLWVLADDNLLNIGKQLYDKDGNPQPLTDDACFKDGEQKKVYMRNGGTLTAVWIPNKYTIRYNSKNGSVISDAIYTPADLTLFNTPTRPEGTDCEFMGWRVAETVGNWTKGEQLAAGADVTERWGNVTLEAVWATAKNTTATTLHETLQGALETAGKAATIKLLANITEKDVTIGATQAITFEANNKTIANLTLEATPTDAATVLGQVTVSSKVEWKMSIKPPFTADATRYQWISLPYDANIRDITFTYGNTEYSGTTLKDAYAGAFVIREYNTRQRGIDAKANAGEGGVSTYFDQVPITGSLSAGKGYVVQFLKSLAETVELTIPLFGEIAMNSGLTISLGDTKEEEGNDWETKDPNGYHQNWYLIGQPYFTQTNLSGNDIRMFTRMVGGNDHYDYFLWFDKVLKPYESFFVQYAGNVTYATPTVQNAPSRLLLAAAQEELEDEYYLLTLADDSFSRRIGVILSDEGSPAYVQNRDLLYMGDNGAFHFYSVADQRLVFNDLKREPQSVPLGYAASVAGDYTIRLTDQSRIPDEASVELLDKTTNQSINLRQMDYTFSTAAGTFNERFVLNLKKTSIATDITQTGAATWLVWQEGGTLYVDNLLTNASASLYDISGRLVATGYAIDGTLRFEDLTAGAYVLVSGNERVKVIIK